MLAKPSKQQANNNSSTTDVICHACKKKGHYANKCPNKTHGTNHITYTDATNGECPDDCPDHRRHLYQKVHELRGTQTLPLIKFKLQGNRHTISCLIDTETDVSVFHDSIVKQTSAKIEHTKAPKLIAASGQEIPTLGFATVPLLLNNNPVPMEVIVSSKGAIKTPLLEQDFIEKYSLAFGSINGNWWLFNADDRCQAIKDHKAKATISFVTQDQESTPERDEAVLDEIYQANAVISASEENK